VSEQSIWRRHRLLEKQRRDKMSELMAEYDQNVYYPAMRDLRKECEAQGHVSGKYHDNGLGWCWFWCSQCGAAFDKQQYGIIGDDE
jgi:hypothetical protein